MQNSQENEYGNIAQQNFTEKFIAIGTYTLKKEGSRLINLKKKTKLDPKLEKEIKMVRHI